MAQLPSSKASLDQSGAGAAIPSTDVIAILSCSQSGAEAVVRNTTRTQDTLDTFGRGEGLDFAAHLVQRTRLPYLFVKLATAVAGSIGPVDTSGVLGTAQMSVAASNSGPYDDEQLVVEILTGGTLGVAGIEFRYSRDGGRSWSGRLRLGTSLTYTITAAGLTITFGVAGQTLLEDDTLVAFCKAPMWNAAGLAAAFAALAAYSLKPRIIVVTGECASADEVQACIDEISAFETTHGRHSTVLCALRDRFAPAKLQKPRAQMTGAPSDLDFDATGDTITRNTGSWVTDGFVVGMSVTVGGTASNNGVKGVVQTVTATVLTLGASPGLATEANVNGANVSIVGVSPGDVDFDAVGHTITRNIGSWVTDGFKVGMVVEVAGSVSNNGSLGVLTTVTATVLTFASGIVAETNVPGSALTITGTELKATWRAALEAIVGATPQTQKIDFRVLVAGGRAMRASPLDKAMKRRPAHWAIAIREMEHDLHISPAQVDIGPLEGWVITDANGVLQEHDERVDGGLLAARIACLTTLNEKPGGPFVALPVNLDEDNRTLSRLPVVLVGQLVTTVAQRAFSEKLNSAIARNKGTLTIRETEARRIEEAVRTQLEIAVMQPGREGARASSIDEIRIARDVALTPGALVPWEVNFTALGYFEQLSGVVRVS